MKRCVDCRWNRGSFCACPGEPNPKTGFYHKDYTSCEILRMFRLPFEASCGISGRWWLPKQPETQTVGQEK